MRISEELYEDNLNLLLISNEETQHYVLIKDFNQFMSHQTKHKERKFFCMHYLQHFSSEDILNKHKTDCIVINSEQGIKMSNKGEKNQI